MFELQSRTCSTTNEGFYSLNGRQIVKNTYTEYQMSHQKL